MVRPFTDDDAISIRSHYADIEREFSPFFEAREAVFPRWHVLMDRLRSARDACLQYGWSHRGHIDEAHNEICTAYAILEKPASLVRRLDYEPALRGTEKTIDFLAEIRGQPPRYLDVKTIAPRSRDRWEKYEKARDEGRLGDPPMLGLDRNWLGGEIWHEMFAARDRILEHTLELEEKLSLAGLLDQDLNATLLFCSNGYDWKEDALEDFVAFYVGGSHRFDDFFAVMERHHIESSGLRLPRMVRTFSYLERPSWALRAEKVVWGVTPPNFDGRS